jgi:hypothetical protein
MFLPQIVLTVSITECGAGKLLNRSLLRVGRHVRPLRHRAHDAARDRHERRGGSWGRSWRLRIQAEAAVQEVSPIVNCHSVGKEG